MASRTRQPRERERGRRVELRKGKEKTEEKLDLSRGGPHSATGPGIISVVHSEGSTAFGASKDRG